MSARRLPTVEGPCPRIPACRIGSARFPVEHSRLPPPKRRPLCLLRTGSLTEFRQRPRFLLEEYADVTQARANLSSSLRGPARAALMRGAPHVSKYCEQLVATCVARHRATRHSSCAMPSSARPAGERLPERGDNSGTLVGARQRRIACQLCARDSRPHGGQAPPRVRACDRAE